MSNWGIRFFICNLLICLFIGVIIGAKRLLKKYLSARLQYNLWLILLLLLAVPFLPTGTPFLSRFFSWCSSLFSAESQNSASNIQNLPLLPQSSPLDRMNDFAVSVSSQAPSAVNALLLTLWGIGVFVMLVLAFRSWKQLRILEQSALPLQNVEINNIYQKCLSETKTKRTIPVYSTAFLKSPVTVGLFRPRIYVPIHLISNFNPQDMRFMLLHELQHCRHRDTLVGHFMNLAGILYWFNPLVWHALKEMRCDREVACDSAVLQLLRETDYEAYGNTLINLAEKLSSSPFPFAAGISGNMRQIRQRILNIAGFKKETTLEKMRGMTVFLSIAALLLGCAPALSIYASAPNDYHFNEEGKHISYLDLSGAFQGYDGSFVLYDTRSDSWSIYHIDAARERISPNSTYKIYDALLGLESGVITPAHSAMAWNGESYPFASWEADQDLTSAMRDSVNWYFQAIDSQLGFASIKPFLKEIGYGNQITSRDLDLYWTDLSLKISPLEQVELLKKFHDNTFQFDPQNVDAVKNAIRLTSTSEGTFYGKTGTGRVDGRDVNGWFIGYIEKTGNVYYFAANIQGKSEATGSKAAEITASVLADLRIWE